MGPKNCFYVKKFFSVIFSQKIQNLGRVLPKKMSQIRGRGGGVGVTKEFPMLIKRLYINYIVARLAVDCDKLINGFVLVTYKDSNLENMTSFMDLG